MGHHMHRVFLTEVENVMKLGRMMREDGKVLGSENMYTCRLEKCSASKKICLDDLLDRFFFVGRRSVFLSLGGLKE